MNTIEFCKVACLGHVLPGRKYNLLQLTTQDKVKGQRNAAGRPQHRLEHTGTDRLHGQ